MEILVKARFNSSRERFETYGRNKYLIYLPFPEDEDSLPILIEILSRQMGIPQKNIIFKRKSVVANDWVFEVN